MSIGQLAGRRFAGACLCRHCLLVNVGSGACHLRAGEHGSDNPSKHANAFPVLRSYWRLCSKMTFAPSDRSRIPIGTSQTHCRSYHAPRVYETRMTNVLRILLASRLSAYS